MTASAKQNQTEPACSIGKCCVAKYGDAGGKSAVSQPGIYPADDDGALVGWSGGQQVRPRVGGWTMTDQRQEELQSTEYIESRTLKWIKQLEQIADLALRPLDDLPPDCDLAAKILLGLVSCRASAGSG